MQGSGGTTTYALAGGGNQSFLTETSGEAWGMVSSSGQLIEHNDCMSYSYILQKKSRKVKGFVDRWGGGVKMVSIKSLQRI